MKDFIITSTSKSLTIKRKRKAIFIFRLLITIQVLAISILVSYFLNTQIDAIENKTTQFIVVFLIAFAIYSSLFVSDFISKDLVLLKKDDVYNVKNIEVKKSTIYSIIIEEYISADSGGGSKKVRLSCSYGKITLLKGLNTSEAEEISKVLAQFFDLSEASIKYNHR